MSFSSETLEKRQKRSEFKAPPRLTAKGSNKDSSRDHVCCVVDYHSAMSCSHQMFRKIQNIVVLSSEFAKVLKGKPFWVRSKLRKKGDQENSMVQCGMKRCQVCNFIRQRDEFKCSSTARTYCVSHIFFI